MILSAIYGPPGTGKTTTLLGIVEHALSQGISPEEIGYFAFTKKAADEAVERAAKRFNLPKNRFVSFKTLHSLAFRQLRLSRQDVVSWHHYKELGTILGLEIKGMGGGGIDDEGYGMLKGDRLFFVENLARNMRLPLREYYDKFMLDDIEWIELKHTADTYIKYKSKNMLFDFTDMLERYIEDTRIFPKFKVLIVDEAQDLSTLQWDLVKKLMANAEKVYVAGDDDQAIYRWAGADVEQFISLPGNKTILNHSYRLPRSIFNYAGSILGYIENRVNKEWGPRDADGVMDFYTDIYDIDMSEGNWLLLSRNGVYLKKFEEMCKQNGFAYDSVSRSPKTSKVFKAIKSWEKYRQGQGLDKDEIEIIRGYMLPNQKQPSRHTKDHYSLDETKRFFITEDIWHKAMGLIPMDDKQYFISARKRNESFIGKARIQINTIHSSKGGECDNVVMLTDMTAKTYENMQINMDDEARVFYVGATRAKERLCVVMSDSNYSFMT